MKKLIYINPAGSHNVFLGWHFLFSQYYEYHTYHHDTPSLYENHHPLQYSNLIRIGKNFIVLYKKPNIITTKNDIIVIGDIFTNTLVYKSYNTKNILYYSEFFLFGKSLWKKMFFYVITLLLFRNRKMLVPTKLAYDTYKKTVKNVLYMPTLYYNSIHQNIRTIDGPIKLLFVGRVSQKYKNTYFLIDQYKDYKRKGYNVSLTIVGPIEEDGFLEKYKEELQNKEFIYLGKKTTTELEKIYMEHDVFILPSNSDPIGAVVLEAMAHGLAILVSDSVGASCYIKEGINGHVFTTDSGDDFQEKLTLYMDKNKLQEYKQASYNIVKDNYRVQTNTVIENMYNSLQHFIGL